MYFHRKYETPQFCSSQNEGGGYGFRLFPPPYFRGHKQHLVSELSKKARFVALAVIRVFKIAIRQVVENDIYIHDLYLNFKNSCESRIYFCSVSVSFCITVAVWTQKKFFPLLTRPQGSQGCQKITFFFTNETVFLLR